MSNTVATLDLATASTFDVTLLGSAPGAGGYDQTIVSPGGTISLNNATLNVASPGLEPVGQSFTIIDNETGAPVAGTFSDSGGNSLLEGASVWSDNERFSISYMAGTNHQSVALTATAVTPTISATHATETVSEASVRPFTGVTLADPNGGANETLTISMSGSGGSLTNGSGYTGLTGGGGGIYQLSGTASDVTNELDALSFHPVAGQPGTVSLTTFSLSDVSSQYGQPVTDTSTTVVNSDPFLDGLKTPAPVTNSSSPTASTSDPDLSLFGTVVSNVNSEAGEVYALYQTILGHAPNPLELEQGVAALGKGVATTHVAEMLLVQGGVIGPGGHQRVSDSAFVTQLAENVPGAIQPSLVRQAANSLARGEPLARFAADLALSPTGLNNEQSVFTAGVFVPDATDCAVARLFYALVGHAPDATSLRTAEAAVAAGTSLKGIANELLASPTIAALHNTQTNSEFVHALFEGALGQASGPGFGKDVSDLAHGVPRSTVAVHIAETYMAKTHLTAAIEVSHILA